MLQSEPVGRFTDGAIKTYLRGGNTPEEEEVVRRSSVEETPFNFTPQLLHLHRDHRLFEDGDIQRHMYLQDVYTSETQEDTPQLSVSEFACHITGCSAVFSTLEDYEHHYNSLHRQVCCSCHRSLPTARLLDIHIQEWHDSLFAILAQKQDMYQCLVEGCGQKFRTVNQRKDHLIRFHKYPPDFRFNKTRKDKGSRETVQPQRDTAMEVTDDVCESEDIYEVVCDVASTQQEEESMETPVPEDEAAPLNESASAEQHSDVSPAVHSTASSAATPLKPRYSYRVPAAVCFGHGSIRGFRAPRGRRK
ncbi:zinc finger protein 511 [Thalassophryne amazonica]|uniref:zinc finger protein 511 n=1 Tax=Thalassophryne amazonica TaxID=390379 RepID=UPI001470A02D|nr:zinc finger protein 511 [Thalassophryne amazonica]